MPNGRTKAVGALGDQLLTDILTDIAGEAITLDEATITPVGYVAAVLDLLTRSYGYDSSTGVIESSGYASVAPVTFDYVDRRHVDSYSNVGTEAKPVFRNTGAVIETAFGLVDGVSQPIVELRIPTAKFRATKASTIEVTYFLVSDTGETKVPWIYVTGGGYPELDSAILGESVLDVYPIVTVREDGVNITDSTDPKVVSSSTEALQTLGINIEDITGSLSENDDSDKIEDAHIFLSIHVDDKKQAVMSYLFEYFDLLRVANPGAKDLYDAWVAGGIDAPTTFTGVTYNIDERSLNYQLNLNYVTRSTYSSLDNPEAPVGFMTFHAKQFIDVKGRSADYISYTRKISSSAVEIIRVHGIRNDCVIGTSKSRHATVLVRDLGDTDESKSLVVPLSRVLMESLNHQDRNIVVSASLQLNLYAVVVRKLKWYETGVFKVVLTIAAIVLSILYPPAFVAIAGAYGALTAVALWVVNMIIQTIIGMFIAKIAQIVASIIGGKIAIIIATVVAIYTFAVGSVKVGKDLLLSAETLRQGAMALITGVSANVQEELAGAFSDFERKQEKIEDAYAKLEEYDYLLDEGLDLSNKPEYQTFVTNPFEHPDDFYDRTSDLDFTVTGPTYQLDKFYENATYLPGADG